MGESPARECVRGSHGAAAGPGLASSKIQKNKVRLTFKNADSGLIASTPFPADTNQPVAIPGLTLKGFTIAGTNQVFVRTDAVINGSTVLVSSDKVTAPVAVRYGWEDNPEVNLYNKKGFPAAPFRTNAWPLLSAQAPAVPTEEE